MIQRVPFLTSMTLLMALSACTATVNVTPQVSPSPVASASAAPSVQPSGQPSTQPPLTTPDSPSSVPSSGTGNGKLVVIGADAFAKYNVDYHAGQKWVYKMTLKGLSISLPAGVPAGFAVPGTSDTDIGEMSLEVLKVEGSMVTMKTQVVSKSAPTQIPASTKTFDKNDKTALAKLYVESQNSGTEGTVTWTAAASETVTVAAGNYTADRVNGVFDITTDNGNGVRGKLDQTARLWFANNVGMVKEEVVSKITSTGATAGGGSDSTVVIELKSFTG